MIIGCKKSEIALSNAPFDIKIEKKEDCLGGISVIAFDKKSKKNIGEVYSSLSEDYKHRGIKVFKSYEGFPKGKIAHMILLIINLIEGVLEEENVPFYDLIIFYIREGYIPVERKKNFNLLKNELVKYLKNKKECFELDTMEKGRLVTKLKYSPKSAKKYWQELISQ